MLASFGVSASVRIADPLLPALVAYFDASTARAALTVTVFAFAYGLMQLVWGPLGDRYGKLRVITFTSVLGALCSLAAALAPSLDWLIGFRLAGGLMAAGTIPLSMALIGDRVPYERRQAALGRYLSGGLLGLVSGQFIGGLLADVVSWRAPFLLLAGVTGLAALLLLAELRQEEERPQAPAPLVSQYRAVLGNGWARLVLAVVFVEGAANFGSLAFVPTFLHLRHGLPLTAAGAVVALFGVGGLFYSMVVRRLVGRLGEHGLVLGGGAVLAAGFGVLALLGEGWRPAMPALFLVGLGFYMLHNTLQTHATQMTPAARGTAVSLFAASLFIGNAFGVGAASLAMEAGRPALPFAVSALVLPALALGFSAALRRRPVGDKGERKIEAT